MAEFERSWNSVDNSENMNRNTSIAEGSEKGKNVVEIGANRQSCDPSRVLLFKLVLEAVLGVASSPSERSNMRDRCRIPREIP